MTGTDTVARPRHGRHRQAISTPELIRDLLETFAGDWFTTEQLATTVSTLSGAKTSTVRRALSRLVEAAPDWLDTHIVDGERRYRAPQRSYLWT